MRYVLQRHYADKAGLHYDFRISDGDKVSSWAIPKGLPNDDKKRLAIEQPEHTTDSMNFEGKISEGYGKGTVEIDQEGDINIIDMSPDKVKFSINGTEYNLIKSNNKNWLIMKKK